MRSPLIETAVPTRRQFVGRAFGLGLGIPGALTGIGCGGREDADSASRPLKVGMELAYPPFEMRNAENQPDGISVRMAEDLAAALGRELEIVDVAWDGIIAALVSGKIDLIISSMTRTDEREKTIDFSDGYVTNGLCLLVAKDSPIESVEDLEASGATLAVKLGTTGHTWADANLAPKGVKLAIFDEAAICALEVVQGKADAFIFDQISIYKHWKQHQEETRALLQPVRSETWAIGLRKGEDQLRADVNAFLSAYREAGHFDALADRYMAEEKRTFEEMGVPFIFH